MVKRKGRIPPERMDKFTYEAGDLEIEHSLCSYCLHAVGENPEDCAVFGVKTHTYEDDVPCHGFELELEEEE
ncbi:MAG: hypothetical protein D5R97_00400 [Candidatus Syntrophonatronum acetioxidans]|uniref:Uncharacterized protein n=1 Tax=Candidatus Syntrophonatronum acetioxidans TaxID=1795816 RepID=A0A424YIW3_9FIRM|nr:MAG: hypothetical protein D5R97_00400 [Candidatus Syntrophonatronum acetioxidans]